MPTSIITTDDLREFKLELLESIERLFQQYEKKDRPKTWLRSAEVKERLKISQGTLQKLRDKGTIKAHRLESILFYDAAQIDQVLLANEVTNAVFHE